MSPAEISLAKFGTSFQENLVHLIFEDRAFSDQIREVLDVEFLEVKYLRLFLKRMFDHRDKYGTHPSRDAMTTMLRTELDGENEVVVKQVREFYARILSQKSVVKDQDYIKGVSLEFCKKQKLKEALLESADLINRVSATSYDEVRKKIDLALKLGSENNFGYDYLADFESRFELKARNPISTGWDKINSITQGGLGIGELGVVIAPTGVGKSMVLVHLGAEALKAGKTVVHYTLELGDTVVASRYDSCITGIGLSDLYSRKDEIYEHVKDVPGRLIVKEYPTKTATTGTITNHLEKLIARGIKPDMVIVDYGDLLRPIDKRKEKRNELESIYEEMRALAQIYQCPVWTASQTNRTGLNAEVITMESISEAFNKCFVADFICTVSRTIEDKVNNEGRMFVAKNRNGPDGIVFPIFMETRNVKIKVLNRSHETPESLAVGASKKQAESLKEKYKNFRNSGRKKE